MNRVQSISVKCSACCGTGSVSLTGIHLQTYQFVCDHGEVTALDLCKSDPELSRTNAANRLRHLFDIGVLSMRTKGRTCIYSKGG